MYYTLQPQVQECLALCCGCSAYISALQRSEKPAVAEKVRRLQNTIIRVSYLSGQWGKYIYRISV